MTWSPRRNVVTPGPTSTTTPAPSWPRMAGKRPSGSAPDRVNSSVWQMPLALISIRTSPALGPSSCTVSTVSGAPAACATAAFTSMRFAPPPMEPPFCQLCATDGKGVGCPIRRIGDTTCSSCLPGAIHVAADCRPRPLPRCPFGSRAAGGPRRCGRAAGRGALQGRVLARLRRGPRADCRRLRDGAGDGARVCAKSRGASHWRRTR